jgi:SseB protein C-terminal domain
VPTLLKFSRGLGLLQQFSVSRITFIGEQDGAHDRRLKEAISVLLDLNASVTRAYLARVSYDDGTTASMLLGLVTHDKQQSSKLALQMDRAFGALFNTESHLDVVFLDEEADAQIRKACRPFYSHRTSYH